MDEAAKVYYESGLRGCLSWSTMVRTDFQESIAMTADEAVRLTTSCMIHGITREI